MAALLLSLCDQKVPYLSIYINGNIKFLILYNDTATARACSHLNVAKTAGCMLFLFINGERI